MRSQARLPNGSDYPIESALYPIFDDSRGLGYLISQIARFDICYALDQKDDQIDNASPSFEDKLASKVSSYNSLYS